MKYWIFQNNQVLGPYEPNEMGKISVFSPESLVCPEGRRGTSMGDWQRAGMVPDLSVALVRAGAGGGRQTAVLSIAGLPPEPTLKDLAQLGSIQEKVAMLEEVVLQLQEGLRAKDAELSSVHQELAGKSQEASQIKGEAAARQREADDLKRQLAGLEERLSSVRLLSETLDKAVEEEKRVEQHVEKQGQTLTDLAREVEELRRELVESKSRAPEPAPAPSPFAPPPSPAPFTAPPAPSSFAPEPAPSPFAPETAPSPFTAAPEPFAPAPTLAPLPDIVPPPPAPMPSVTPVVELQPSAPDPSPAAPVEFSPVVSEAVPSFEAFQPMPGMPDAKTGAAGFDPMSFAADAAPAPVPAVAAAPVALAPKPPASKGKKVLLIGGVLGLVALGALAVVGGLVPGMVKPKAPAVVLEPTPLPPPELTPPPAPEPDPRQRAVEFAKAWPLRGGRTLERALEELSPSAGNLSPWMADPLAGSRMQVNYFARSSAPGAPTIAYEFEVDLDGQTLVGRNAAAKSVLTGKAAAPPAPPKPKAVKVKPKAPAAAKTPAPEDSLDTLLGDDAAKPAPAPVPSEPPAAKPAPRAAKRAEAPPPMPGFSGTTMPDSGDAPLDEPSAEAPAEEAPRPAARANPARRAAKAKSAKTPAPASDETLLDDLLKE